MESRSWLSETDDFLSTGYLPDQLRRHLDLAGGRGGTCNDTCRGRRRRGCRGEHHEIRDVEVGVVQDIERISADLKPETLRELCRLPNGCIQLCQGGTS